MGEKAFFSGPGLISEHKDELRTLILGTMVEGKAELSMVSANFTADLTRVTEKLCLSLSLSLYLHDYTVVQYATLPLPYYHHASTVPTLVRLSFPFPSFIISYYTMTALP